MRNNGKATDYIAHTYGISMSSAYKLYRHRQSIIAEMKDVKSRFQEPFFQKSPSNSFSVIEEADRRKIAEMAEKQSFAEVADLLDLSIVQVHDIYREHVKVKEEVVEEESELFWRFLTFVQNLWFYIKNFPVAPEVKFIIELMKAAQGRERIVVATSRDYFEQPTIADAIGIGLSTH